MVYLKGFTSAFQPLGEKIAGELAGDLFTEDGAQMSH